MAIKGGNGQRVSLIKPQIFKQALQNKLYKIANKGENKTIQCEIGR